MKRRLYALYCLTEGLKKRFSARFTTMGKHFLLICLLAFFFGLNVQGSMIYHIFTLTFALLCFSYLVSLRFSTAITIRQDIPETCVSGRALAYTIVVENLGSRRLSSIYYRLQSAEHLPGWQEFYAAREAGEEKRNIFDRKMAYYRWLWLLRIGRPIESRDQELPETGPGRKQQVQCLLLPLRRGNVHLQGSVLTRIDPLGLCKREYHISGPRNLLVLPKIYSLPSLAFPGARKYHRGGISAALAQGDSTDFLSLREYVHGDPVKYIDWKSTARVGRGIVKQYRDEYFCRYGLILDNFTSALHSDLFEEAVAVAASILVSRENDATVLELLFVEDECVTCSVGRGLADQKQMMKILASVSTCHDRDFSLLADHVKSHAGLLSGVVVILIDFDRQRRELIHYLHGLRIPVKAVLLAEDPQEYQHKAEMQGLHVPVAVIDHRQVEEQIQAAL